MNKDTFPGRWDISSAGHVEAGKSIPETARLEIAEELGMEVPTSEFENIAFVIPAEQASMGGCNAYEHVYFLIREATSTQFALGTSEVTDVLWMPVKELLTALRAVDDGYAPRTKQYVDAMEQELEQILGA